MSDLLFALSAILPITLLILLGFVLSKIKLVSREVFYGLNKICYYCLMPVMLFKNIYDVESLASINLKLVLFVAIGIIVLFLLGLVGVILFSKDNKQKGVILQGIFRANYAIIGIPLAGAIAGDEGLRVASLVSLIVIPIANLLATIALTIFVKNEDDKHPVKTTIKKIALNPLILGVVVGLLFLVIRYIFVSLNISFRLTDISALYTAISYVSRSASPLALITLGGLFEFSMVKELRKQLSIVVLVRLIAVPLVFLSIAYFLFDFDSASYAALIGVFASPIAVTSAIMAKELDNDSNLANQIVVWTTLFSTITIFIFIYVFRLLGAI